MILGIFGGTTPAQVIRRVEKLEKEKDAIKETIMQARADRVTALSEIKQDISLLESQLARLG